MKEPVEIERELASTQEALVYANKDKWKYKDKCIDLENLLKECRELLDSYNHTFETKDWIKSSELVTKIDNAIGGK